MAWLCWTTALALLGGRPVMTALARFFRKSGGRIRPSLFDYISDGGNWTGPDVVKGTVLNAQEIKSRPGLPGRCWPIRCPAFPPPRNTTWTLIF